MEPEIPFEEEPQTARLDDAEYLEFFMGPLRESWREQKFNRNPRSLDEAAQVLRIENADGEFRTANYRSFEQYRMARHQQWMLHKLKDTMAASQQQAREARSGQSSLF